MIDQINALLSDVAGKFADRRTQVFDVKVSSLVDRHVSLEGRVLDEATLQMLTSPTCAIRSSAQPLF